MDETTDQKSPADPAGAARQYSSSTTGDVALCQVAVTLTYPTSRGHALIGQALYPPEACAADEEHRGLASRAARAGLRPSRRPTVPTQIATAPTSPSA